MLIKTIRLESEDEQLFSKSAPLLSAASELAYHTINCSALNAEELRREGGIDVSSLPVGSLFKLQFIKTPPNTRQVHRETNDLETVFV